MSGRQLSTKPLWRIPRGSLSVKRRCLHLHSFQSQGLLREAGVPVPRGILAQSVNEVKDAFKTLNGPCFIKPQISKASQGQRQNDSNIYIGSQIATSLDEGAAFASQILRHQLRSDHARRGSPTTKVYVEETVDFDKSWQLCMTIDRENYCPVIEIRARTVDGVSQAQRLSESPATFNFSLTEGITPALTKAIALEMRLSDQELQNIDHILKQLYAIFAEKEATSLAINSLVRRSADDQLLCLDSDFTFDDAAEGRQPAIFALRDYSQEISDEVEAENHGLVYVRMDGDIGNVVNGAGLAMATNDAISLYGGKSANFLDGGGKATKDTMLQAFGIILRDERVKAILVNTYGGLTRCDMIAESVIAAASELGPLRVPVVVRLQGTNSAEGLKLLKEADLGLHVEADFGEAARRVVEVARQG